MTLSLVECGFIVIDEVILNITRCLKPFIILNVSKVNWFDTRKKKYAFSIRHSQMMNRNSPIQIRKQTKLLSI